MVWVFTGDGGLDRACRRALDSSRMEENQFRAEDQRRAALTQSEREKILGINPSFQEITRATYFDNYDLPCPIKS